RRLAAYLSALAFKAFEHGGFFAADVGAGAYAHFEVEGAARAGDVMAQPARSTRVLYGAVERGHGVGVFGAHIDVAVGGAHSQSGHGHALNEGVGVALHDHAVGERARIAFIGVTGNVFLLGRGTQDG